MFDLDRDLSFAQIVNKYVGVPCWRANRTSVSGIGDLPTSVWLETIHKYYYETPQ